MGKERRGMDRGNWGMIYFPKGYEARLDRRRDKLGIGFGMKEYRGHFSAE